MIPSNELRVGVWVNDRGSQPFQILPNYILGQYQCEIAKTINIDCNPIPLTEEWLVNFGIIKKYYENQFEEGGFEKDENGKRFYFWVKGAFNLEIQSNGEIWFEVYSHYIHVKFVHQLQNLYFALTGEELTIKEPAELKV